MKYVSGRDGLKVDDGPPRNYGDPVPEAADWVNLRSYLAGRFILEVPDDWEPPKPEEPPAPAGLLESPWPNGYGPNPGIDELSAAEMKTVPAQQTEPGALASGDGGQGGNSGENADAQEEAQNASEDHSTDDAAGTTAHDLQAPADDQQQTNADSVAAGAQTEADPAAQAGGTVLATVQAPQGAKAPTGRRRAGDK